MSLSFEDAVCELKEGGTLELVTKDGDYEIGSAENFVGGEGSGGYISEVLGNIVYYDAKEVLDKTIKYLMGNNGLEVEINLV